MSRRKKRSNFVLTILMLIFSLIFVLGCTALQRPVVIEAEEMSHTSGRLVENGWLLDKNGNLSAALAVPDSWVGRNVTLEIIASGTQAKGVRKDYMSKYFITDENTLSVILNSGEEDNGKNVAVELIKSDGKKQRTEKTTITYKSVKDIMRHSGRDYTLYINPAGDTIIQSVKVLNDLEFVHNYTRIPTAEAWPVITIRSDGKKIGSLKISSEILSSYQISLQIERSDTILTLEFLNWYELEQDGKITAVRTLFVDKITARP